MKINEKNLCAFATSATPVDREGWLGKRGDVNKAFQRRWFVLKGNLLFYFEKRQDKEPLGVIVLEGCTIELSEDEEQFSFCVSFHGAQARAYVLCADTQDSMEHWMKALACASYDYMKLMVAELQRQLDELEELGSNEGAVGGAEGTGPPRAPPRGQRYNPFNKLADSKHNKGKIERPPENVPRSKISFRELHMLYGRKVLADYNEWRHKHNMAEQTANTTNKQTPKEEDTQKPLIML